MCNRYGYQAPVSRLADAFGEIDIPLRFKDGAESDATTATFREPFKRRRFA